MSDRDILFPGSLIRLVPDVPTDSEIGRSHVFNQQGYTIMIILNSVRDGLQLLTQTVYRITLLKIRWSSSLSYDY